MSSIELVSRDKVVSFHYTLKNAQGEVVDSSRGSEPLVYLHGYQQIVAGLEAELVGKAPGANFQVTVAPKDGYGEREEEMVFSIPKKDWTLPEGVGAGEVVELQSPEGEVVPAMIVEINEEVVVLDANHPLAGESLFFDVELLEVRAATAEEIEHQHVHGPGGHHHEH